MHSPVCPIYQMYLLYYPSSVSFAFSTQNTKFSLVNSKEWEATLFRDLIEVFSWIHFFFTQRCDWISLANSQISVTIQIKILGTRYFSNSAWFSQYRKSWHFTDICTRCKMEIYMVCLRGQWGPLTAVCHMHPSLRVLPSFMNLCLFHHDNRRLLLYVYFQNITLIT